MKCHCGKETKEKRCKNCSNQIKEKWLQRKSRNYCKEHPIDNWDDEMISYINIYCSTPEWLWEEIGITERVFTRFMAMMSSYCLTRREMWRLRRIEKEERLLKKLDKYQLAKQEQKAIEEMKNEWEPR